MKNGKFNVLGLLKILHDHSDERHILSMSDIMAKSEEMYGVKPDRRTVYAFMEQLIDAEYDISVYGDNGIGYYLRQREIDINDVRVLIDALYAYECVTPEQTRAIVERLKKTLPEFSRSKSEIIIVKQNDRVYNYDIYRQMEVISRAIRRRVKITFKYKKHGFDLKLVPRSERPYIVNPHALIAQDGRYYLVASDDNANINIYRADYISDCEETDITAAVSGDDKRAAINIAVDFISTPEKVYARCGNAVLSDLIDKFGTDMEIEIDGDKAFTVVFNGYPKSVKTWALQNLQQVEILSPPWIREDIVEAVRGNLYK